ncbi:MAG TPA: hypothetical protein VHB21_20105, partial [Minicystis sp.]|nr:hypothetical protein [Minicystis sp.]
MSAEDELGTLRGAVRDGGAAIESLASVLASRRVGPRVIARALPEVRAGCLVLGAALERLRGVVARELAADPGGAAASEE